MEKKQAYWEGLAAGYFFLSSMGVMMFAAMAVLDFFGAPVTRGLNGLTGLVALVVAGIGPLLLILELGNKKKFYLLAISPPTIMTIGPMLLGAFFVVDIIYSGFFFSFVPWFGGYAAVKTALGAIGIFLGLCFIIYPGFELGEARGRGFWNTASLVPLFMIASVVSGLAGVLLVANIKAMGSDPAIKAISIALTVALVIFLVMLLAYIWGMKHSGAEEARRSAEILTKGELSGNFWITVIVIGIVIPIVLLVFGTNPIALTIKAVAVLLGGFYFRNVFLETAVRKTVPGEENIIYSEKDLAILGAQLEKRWQEKAAWLNNM